MTVSINVDRTAIAAGGKATVTLTSDENMYAVECRATLSGAPWGRGIGTDVLSDDIQTSGGIYVLPSPSTSFSFDVESAELVSGDGTYRVTIYTRDSRGVWDDTVLYTPSGSSGLRTMDGLKFKVQKR